MSAHCTTEDPTLTATGKLRVFINVYVPMNGACGAAYKTRQLADQMAGNGRIACVEAQYDPGEGLE